MSQNDLVLSHSAAASISMGWPASFPSWTTITSAAASPVSFKMSWALFASAASSANGVVIVVVATVVVSSRGTGVVILEGVAPEGVAPEGVAQRELPAESGAQKLPENGSASPPRRPILTPSLEPLFGVRIFFGPFGVLPMTAKLEWGRILNEMTYLYFPT